MALQDLTTKLVVYAPKHDISDYVMIDGTKYNWGARPDGVLMSAGDTVLWHSTYHAWNKAFTICADVGDQGQLTCFHFTLLHAMPHFPRAAPT